MSPSMVNRGRVEPKGEKQVQGGGQGKGVVGTQFDLACSREIKQPLHATARLPSLQGPQIPRKHQARM